MKRSASLRISGLAAIAAFALLAAIAMLGQAAAVKCPYTGAPTPTDYAEVWAYPVEKYVGKEITFTITDVWKDGSKTVAKNRLIIIYYIVGEEVVSEYDIYTDNSGVGRFTPEDSGRYAVATSHRYLFFDVLARCGDGKCTYGETRIGCPADCAKCGDSICDAGETKETCPKDCVKCGDDVCDIGENRNNCPADCARCGDDVCDINENKMGCPEDCVICGDGVCDYLELVSLHNTTCPEDCTECGDGYCDFPEDAATCPDDCVKCGDDVCGPGENSSCPKDCNVCGDGVCDYDENKTNCPLDCSICGDSVCDQTEIMGLHETTCAKDCATCGDGYCDKGESSSCDVDCKDKLQGALMGYLPIPLAIIALLIIYETLHYLAVRKRPKIAREEAAKAAKEASKRTKLKKMEPSKVLPYLLIFTFSLVFMTVLLAVMDLRYEKNLAVLDVGMWLLNNGPLISLMVIALAAGIGLLARATYYMVRPQALSLTLIFTFLGMLPGLFIFLSIEYLMLMTGVILGAIVATFSIKGKEADLAVRKPFSIGSDAADKMLTVAALLICLMVFVQLYVSDSTAEKLSIAIKDSQATGAMVADNFGPQADYREVQKNVVDPFLGSTSGGMSGRLLFAGGAALLLFAIVKLFIVVIRLLAGFFGWMLDKSGFV